MSSNTSSRSKYRRRKLKLTLSKRRLRIQDKELGKTNVQNEFKKMLERKELTHEIYFNLIKIYKNKFLNAINSNKLKYYHLKNNIKIKSPKGEYSDIDVIIDDDGEINIIMKNDIYRWGSYYVSNNYIILSQDNNLLGYFVDDNSNIYMFLDNFTIKKDDSSEWKFKLNNGKKLLNNFVKFKNITIINNILREIEDWRLVVIYMFVNIFENFIFISNDKPKFKPKPNTIYFSMRTDTFTSEIHDEKPLIWQFANGIFQYDKLNRDSRKLIEKKYINFFHGYLFSMKPIKYDNINKHVEYLWTYYLQVKKEVKGDLSYIFDGKNFIDCSEQILKLKYKEIIKRIILKNKMFYYDIVNLLLEYLPDTP